MKCICDSFQVKKKGGGVGNKDEHRLADVCFQNNKSGSITWLGAMVSHLQSQKGTTAHRPPLHTLFLHYTVHILSVTPNQITTFGLFALQTNRLPAKIQIGFTTK